jgi:hypothetical protein
MTTQRDGLWPIVIVLALPVLACIVMVLHDPGVHKSLLVAALVVFVVAGAIAGGVLALLIGRETRA